MKHIGTHIELLCGKKSKFGRDERLWQSLVNNPTDANTNGDHPPRDSNGEGNNEVNQRKALTVCK